MRMRHQLATAVAVLAVSGAAISPALATSPRTSSADDTFLRTAHRNNLAEIATAKDAGKNATTSCVKRVAKVLVRDHMKMDDEVKKLADKLRASLPGSPTDEQKKQLAALRAKAHTKAYDAAWLKAQAAGHEKTLDLIDHELKYGHDEKVRHLAKKLRPTVVMHLGLVHGGTCHDSHNDHKAAAGNGS
ncbi:DUF4142 domain-containing protein [Streptomyces netropsis]|uniref:Putative membrane protein n=1 Tax=Streptomyces netropsis TaxID=55404 RepID=A0A7W7PIB5_STRNE|nr:DUF4142 domain-containing protein [Streptomyces netropsis]MBB4889625.1 putative membrane protein [Streptomyces netropsis]